MNTRGRFGTTLATLAVIAFAVLFGCPLTARAESKGLKLL